MVRVFEPLKMLLILALLLGVLDRSTAATAQDNTIAIEFWVVYSQEAEITFLRDVAAEYMAAHPGVEIRVVVPEGESFTSRLNQVMNAGTPPDLFPSWGGGRWLWDYAEDGLLRDITPELTAAWYDSFAVPAALDLFRYDGRYYGVPCDWGVVGMFYNRSLFAQAGLDPETPPATWDEFLTTVQTLKDAGITPIALAEKDRWPGHFWWTYLALRLGGEDAFLAAYDRTGSFTDAPFVQAGEYLHQLIALDPFHDEYLALSYTDQVALMAEGQAAMELSGVWAPEMYAMYGESSTINGDIGWFPFPAIPAGAGNPGDIMGGGIGVAVGRDAPDAAVDFLRYLTSVEVQQRGTGILWTLPTVQGAETAITDPLLLEMWDTRNQTTYAQLYYDLFLPPVVGDTLFSAVEDLFIDARTPEEAAQMIEDEAALELGP